MRNLSGGITHFGDVIKASIYFSVRHRYIAVVLRKAHEFAEDRSEAVGRELKRGEHVRTSKL